MKRIKRTWGTAYWDNNVSVIPHNSIYPIMFGICFILPMFIIQQYDLIGIFLAVMFSFIIGWYLRSTKNIIDYPKYYPINKTGRSFK